ncbi:YIP1 family protein [Haloarchaeobius sp. HRN-SO-5]|uniref:YIP1 family protein n=1 Tax=Haloarchaeobius sp. HRN-SO-5 TaxID=3446118 RepID=UPI003EBD9F86
MVPYTPLVRPKEYFEGRRDVLMPAMGVFAVYVVGGVLLMNALVNTLVAQIERPPAGLDAALNQVMGTVVFMSVIIAIVALLVVAAIMHYLSGSGQFGAFSDAVAVAGWAYAPNAIFIPLQYGYARNQIRQLSFDGSDPAVLARQFEAVQSQFTAVSMVLHLLIVAWSVYILAKGIAGTHDCTVDETIGPALLVGVGALVMQFLF